MSNNNPVTEDVCAARRVLNDERFGRDKERLEKTEELLNKVSECQIQLTEISKTHAGKIADHEKRLDDIEHQPKAWMDKIISGIIAAAISFAMGYLLN